MKYDDDLEYFLLSIYQSIYLSTYPTIYKIYLYFHLEVKLTIALATFWYRFI